MAEAVASNQAPQAQAQVSDQAQASDESSGVNQEVSAPQEQSEAPSKKMLAETELDALVQIKIDGVMHEMPVRDALKLQSLEKASQSRMEKAAKLEKQVQEFVKWASKNPDQFLKETGIDPDDFAEARLAKKYEMMQLSPEQKELLELRQWKEWYEKDQAEQKSAQEAKALSAKEAEMMDGLQKEFVEAWKDSGLPVDSFFGSRVAFEMLSAAKQKRDLSPKDAAARVKEAYLRQTRGILSLIEDPEQLRQVLGDVVLKRLKQDDIKRATDNQAASMGLKKNGPAQAASPKPKAGKMFSENEWREQIRKMAESAS